MTKQVKLGIIGLGNMGTGHARNIMDGKIPDIALTAIADIDPARLQWAKENLPEGIALFATAEELMASGTCEAVLIAVPHYEHPTLAVAAMKQKLHVMVEKPAGVYTRQVRKMNEFADNAGVVFGMMFNQRTNPVYRKMHEIIHSGSMGAIKRTNWLITNWYRTQAYYDSGSWRATWAGEGGGVLLNQCPHNLDLWQWICGMPNKIHAYTHNGKWHDIEVEDDVTAYVEYPNGATGVFITSTADAPGTNRFEVMLEWGKLVCENDKLTQYLLAENERDFCKTSPKGFGSPAVTVNEIELEGENLQHVGVLRAFADAILRGGKLVAEGQEGINGLTLSNAMHLSSWLNRAIELPLDEDQFLDELNKRRETSRLKETQAVHFDTSGSYGSKPVK
ncbi:MAG: Gfo/Idh/MocA family oxidoreductase [Clostridiaceae bacterium]|jgi:predicted dehydrogenase|nr:Gfo/Idh/MocA family oxidoreductase [Clostridiaceae bacterium]